MHAAVKKKGTICGLEKRFDSSQWAVTDRKTGLMWIRDAGVSEFPLTWKEAFSFIENLNREEYAGHGDWRLPNRRELFSLVSHDRVNPPLFDSNAFFNVFHGYYWTASTCARLPDQAWYVHFGGAKVYRGMKYASNMVWPVRETVPGGTSVAFTGQRRCYDEKGGVVSCETHFMQHGAISAGIDWPEPRFEAIRDTVRDHMTGLMWTRKARFGENFMTWQEGLDRVSEMNRGRAHGFSDWRMPDVRELESLADLGRHSPSLPEAHPFSDLSDFYWSATTSMYEQRYAWTFYMTDGAVGVGFKDNPEFSLWPVRRAETTLPGNLF